MRAFIAVSLVPNDNIRKLLESISVLPGSKVTGGDEMHITLSFLGEITDQEMRNFCSMLSQIKSEGFEIMAGKVGGFPSIRRARVAFIGISSEELVKLHETVVGGLPDRFRESREFVPHLTVSRFKRPADLSLIASENISRDFGSYKIDRVSLYRSDLRPDGAVYTEICGVQLM